MRYNIVEYKRGKPKPDDRDKVQLCAQAICLEEMLAITLDYGIGARQGARNNMVCDGIVNMFRFKHKIKYGDIYVNLMNLSASIFIQYSQLFCII